MSVDLALERMRAIDGWLTDDEGRLLYETAVRAGGKFPFVEVGSYLGRSTVVLATAAREAHVAVYAIDPHTGVLDEHDRREPTYERFEENVRAAGCSAQVIAYIAPREDVDWSTGISLLFVDGLHDYENVRGDFEHFASHLVEGARVAFHDYDQPGPEWGVTRFVDELLADGWVQVELAEHLIVIERSS